MEKGINQEKPISSVIRERIREAGAPFAANDNIAQYIREGEMPQLEAELEEKIQGVLETLLIDTENDHNTAWRRCISAKFFPAVIRSAPGSPSSRT